MSPGLLDIPQEVLHLVLNCLPLSAIYRLGAVCRVLYLLIHQDEVLWRRRVRRQLRLVLFNGDLPYRDSADVCGSSENGLIRDPTLQGHKELFLLCSEDFQRVLQTRAGCISEQLERLLRPVIPKSWWSMGTTSIHSRLALFGPGKSLLHKIVQTYHGSLDAADIVTGLPGGFGSGVRVDFRQMYTFDLVSLHSQRQKIIEESPSVNGENPQGIPRLHQNVFKLLPTLDGLVFAVDSFLDAVADKEETERVRKELVSMVKGADCGEARSMPLLVLGCDGVCDDIDLCIPALLADYLELWKLSRPWAAFVVDVDSMRGLENALRWMLYHVRKRRAEWAYHTRRGRI